MRKRASRICTVIPMAVAAISIIQPARAQYTFHPPSSKIDGEILAHRQAKAELLEQAVSAQAAQQALAEQGIAPSPLNTESCALYVEQPLSEDAKQELAADGIVVHDTYVPPVPGKHPYGFYLATVSYDALDEVQADPRIVMLTSAAMLHEPMNDQAAIQMNVDDVHGGVGVPARDGTGIDVAVADSSLDTTHPDIPTPVEAYDVTDGVGIANWGTNVMTTISDHGTHVTGSAVGRGTQSGGTYKGTAPGANLYFYKIGNDSTGSATTEDEIEAITRAGAVGCEVFTMSYGGLGIYNDGSEPVEQTIDAAVAGTLSGQVNPMVVFISAGNYADDDIHDSVSVAPGASSPAIELTVNNSAGSTTYTTVQSIRLIWRDDAPANINITLACSNLGAGEAISSFSPGSSVRGTESRRYTLTPRVPAGTSKTYNLIVSNIAASGSTPLVHLFNLNADPATFDSPDNTYTVASPAVADEVIAVGAWVSRTEWNDYLGSPTWDSGHTLNTIAPFSSLGPRVDGVTKPNLVAGGSVVVSCRDSVVLPLQALIVHNTGLNDGNLANSQYAVKAGTSMACPLAAGVAALLLEQDPTATPAEIRSYLQDSASQAGSPDNTAGYGLIDAAAAMGVAVPIKFRQFLVD